MGLKLGFYSEYRQHYVVFSLYKCQKLTFEIFGPCSGDSNMAPKSKKTGIWLPDWDFFQGLEMESRPSQ